MEIDNYMFYTKESATTSDADFRQKVDEANKKLPHDLDMDTVVRLCDTNIQPVYPVRYGYVNFFGETLEKAQLPPDIRTLMHQTNSLSLRNRRGYAARILRPGWIYVKEEGLLKTRVSKQEGDLLIFKYQPETVDIKGKEGIIENFIQYERKKDNSSWGEIRPASGRAGLAYPFLSIRKDVQKISIVYSEVPFSQSILEKMDNDVSFRAGAMQLIDLDDSHSPHAITATGYNFNYLVEDFKLEEIQFEYYKHGLLGPDLSSFSPSDVTTQDTYRLSSYTLMKQMESLLCPHYKDKGKIIILHDPVGYQRDILMAYSLLALWRTGYSATYSYPITIGQFVEKISESNDSKIKKYFNECIDQYNWKVWWPKLNYPINSTGKKLEELLQLYKSFFEEKGVSDQLGGLSHYFKYFFSLSENKDVIMAEDAEEFEIYCTLLSELLEPLNSSEEGFMVLEHILGGELAAEESSSWAVVNNGIVNTLGHAGADKEQVAKILIQGINKILSATGNLLARFFVFAQEKSYKGVLKLHSSSVKQITDILIPKILGTLGFEIKRGEYTELTEKQYYDFLKKTEEKGNYGKTSKDTANVELSLKKLTGKKIFDWSNRLNNYNDDLKIKVSTLELKRKEFNFKFKLMKYDNKTISHLLNCSLSGVDLFMKSYTLYSLMSMSRFDRNDPFKLNKQPLYFFVTYMNNVIGGLIAAQSFFEATGKALGAATRLAEKMNSLAVKALLDPISRNMVVNGELMAVLASRGVVVATGFISSGLSYYDALNSFNVGNNPEGYSHLAISAGAATMAVAWWLAGGALAGMTLGTSVLFWLGVSAILGGTLGLIIFGQANFETLLKNCFWGNGDRYAFWDMDRLSLDTQLGFVRYRGQNIQNAFIVECREFLNRFIVPVLKRENDKKGKIKYKFILPDFKWGESELYYNIFPSYLVTGINDDNPYMASKINIPKYHIAKSKFEEVINVGFSKLIDNEENGITTLTVEMDMNDSIYIDVFWYYMPTKDTISPMRFLWAEKPEFKNAIYGYDNEVLR
ncbi:hypothetical protein Xbed_00577 [Xenorhabdus beddingii]|uniref:Toxin VasX N-terminal region domain-containing protein n=1 Tax=Xenorhabdus beddingii TaxID=40578 RepID=A0A1Y2SSP5_9GAMM|nr:toxin VasX [Xenorhabdus beddingii]OTA21348.1 hypothetical protein Xbed_00577 [Xenorhabdus beddingii]